MKNLDSQTLLAATERLLSDYDIPEHLSGFDYIADAIVMKLTHERSVLRLNDIYTYLANKHNKSTGSISRDVNYAIKQSNKLGALLSLSDNQLFSGRVISVLAIRVKSIFLPAPTVSAIS